MTGIANGASGRMHRRLMLRVAVGGAATAAVGAVLVACGSGAAPTTAPVATTVTTTAPPPAVTAGASAVASPAAVNVTPAMSMSPAAMTMPATAAPAANPTMGAMTAADGKLPSPNLALGVPDAFTKPPLPFKSVAMPPGKGEKVTVFSITYSAPPPPKDKNRYWQELEKRLGVTWDVTISPAADYEAKFASTVAGGNLPDLMFFSPPPGYEKLLLQGAFADLTPYLSGDGLKEFPNLAAFPPVLWKNVSLNKKIYGVPRPRPLANSSFLFRQDWADKLGIAQPKNADELFNLFVAMTKNDPDGNGKADTWAISSNSPRPNLGLGVNEGIISAMFGVPNNWRLNADGSLTFALETDEFKQGLAYARRLWDAGAYHPDALNLSTQQDKDLMIGGRIGMYQDGVTGLPGATGVRGKAKMNNPNANVSLIVPPGFGGGKPAYAKYIGYFGFTAIPASVGKDKERTKMLLRVLDWFTAPFGSEENIFRTYGVEGVDHTVQADGSRITTDTGKAEITDGLNGLTNGPQTFYYSDAPGDAQLMQAKQLEYLTVAIDDPTWGYYSPTNAQKNGELTQLIADRRNAIIAGRAPLSDLDQLIKDWRSRGGDQIRKEYQDTIKSA